MRDTVLALNRLVWILALGAWTVVLAAGSYLGKIHLQALGAVSLAVTSLLGLGWVLSAGRASHRGLGVLANGLLFGELVFHLAAGSSSRPWREIALGSVLSIALVGLPLAILLAGPAAEDEG